MSVIKNTIMTLGLLGALFSGVKCVSNISSWHKWDKNVTEYVQLASSAVQAGAQEGTISMETSLQQAVDNAGSKAGKNLALIYKTGYSDVSTFQTLGKLAVERTREIASLENGLRTGEAAQGSPKWVTDTIEIFGDDAANSPLVQRLAYSEETQTIARSYQALNDVVAGGAISDSGIKNSLVNIMESAGNQAFWKGDCTDYKRAAALTEIALIKANMGYLDEAINDFKAAEKIVSQFPDDRNLSLTRGTITMSNGALRQNLEGAIRKYEELNDRAPSLKYTAGWWAEVTKYGESIGGKDLPSLLGIASNIGEGYTNRAFLWGLLGLGLGAVGVAAFINRDEY